MKARRRGYTMILVLLVLLLLALSMGTLVWHLSANIAETRRVITTIRANAGAMSALDAAGRVITGTFKVDPSADPETLLDIICTRPNADCSTNTLAGTKLPRHLAPPGVEMVDFNILTIRQRSPTIRKIDTGKFIDRLAVEEAVLVVSGVQDVKTGRRALHTDRYVVPSIPITNFALFDTASVTRWTPPVSIRRANDGAPSRIHVNGPTLNAADLPAAPLQIGTDIQHINLLTSTTGTDQILRPRVAAPLMSTKQAGIPHSFRWLVEPPTSADTTTQRAARLAVEADLVIIDGVWYLNVDKTQPWPGKPIFSEHGGSSFAIPEPADAVVASTANVGLGDLGYNAGEFPKLYSWYDRATATGNVRAQGDDGGTISYGPLAVQTSTDSCTTDAECGAGRECYRTTASPGVCIKIEPAAWTAQCSGTGFKTVSACNGKEVEAALDGTRSGFRDNGKRILPINFNVREFTRALQSTDPNELGAIIGSRFNGIVYITTRFKTADYPRNTEQSSDKAELPNALCYKENNSNPGFRSCPGNAGNTESSSFAALSQQVIPVGLCTAEGVSLASGGFNRQPCESASRPNAVRVYGASVVNPTVFPKGLTIATDLPLYAYGDINRVQPNTPHMKVALVADRITFQSRGWRDRFHPWFDTSGLTETELSSLLGGGTAEPATGVQVLETSLITGVPLRSGGVHDVSDAFRTTQTWEQNFFIIRGHIILGFNSEWFRDISDSDDEDDDADDEEDDSSNDVRSVGKGLRWLPDYHLDNPAFQPPGMPLVSLPPTSRYRQQF